MITQDIVVENRKEDEVTNSELLMAKISESGLKFSFIASKLGITRAGLYKKVNNQSQFKQTELYMLCMLLGINTLAEIKAIFFNLEVSK